MNVYSAATNHLIDRSNEFTVGILDSTVGRSPDHVLVGHKTFHVAWWMTCSDVNAKRVQFAARTRESKFSRGHRRRDVNIVSLDPCLATLQ
jgi:hypothetical protein